MKDLKIDRTDRRILRVLQREGRLSNQQLAERVGLSTSPCWRRVKRLEESGVIERYLTLVNAADLGFDVLAYARVSLQDHSKDTLRRFNQLIQAQPQVQECYATSGGDDYLIRVVSPSMQAYFDFLTGELLVVPGIQSVNTSFVLRREKYTTELPVLAD